MNNKTEINKYIPIETSYYIPAVVDRLLKRIKSEKKGSVVLFGFGENMKWLFRLLSEMGASPKLSDWRPFYLKYDCGGTPIVNIKTFKNRKDILLVCCLEEVSQIKSGMRFLFENNLNNLPVIYDRSEEYNPFLQEEPFKTIRKKALERAKSMISDAQLFDLIQFIRLTQNVPGDVVEFGSLHGGSGAILVEALNHFGRKPVWLFDSFEGIPKSKYGLDYRWNNSFSNNSFTEVQNAFADCNNVRVIKGNICKTFKIVESNISFGYLASDTLETGEVLLNFMWPKLSVGGIICVCDYGSFPNCLPLTMYVDRFFENRKDAWIYHPAKCGIVIKKTAGG
jgi:hypothetical protein